MPRCRTMPSEMTSGSVASADAKADQTRGMITDVILVSSDFTNYFSEEWPGLSGMIPSGEIS
jgi:hypothetical protein